MRRYRWIRLLKIIEMMEVLPSLKGKELQAIEQSSATVTPIREGIA